VTATTGAEGRARTLNPEAEAGIVVVVRDIVAIVVHGGTEIKVHASMPNIHQSFRKYFIDSNYSNGTQDDYLEK